MITKQTWEIYRRNQELPLFIIYDFYLEHKKADRKTMTVAEFEKFLPTFIQQYEGLELIIDGDTTKKIVVTYQQIAYKVGRFYEETYYSNEINYGEINP